MIPQTIGRYEIKSEMGRGGMATVYHGYDPRFKRDVAVKVLPREFLHDPAFRARFEREAETIAALEHPAIVPVHDFGEEDGQPYIVMRLMTGGSLAERLERGPLPLTEGARFIRRLAPALDRAHARGVIHRDLKPGNILFDDDDNPYISDFGIAKLTQASATFTGSAIIGTPTYMSPEQARGEKDIDGRSDIYALGAILFQMLTGRFPYEADTPMGIAIKHITEPPPRILEVRPDLPEGCETVIQRAMAKNRDERYSTAGEVAAALTAMAARSSGQPSTLTNSMMAPAMEVSPYADTAAPPVTTQSHTAPSAPTQPVAPPSAQAVTAARGTSKRRIGRWVVGFFGVAVLIALAGLALSANAALQARQTETAIAFASATAAEQSRQTETVVAVANATATWQAQQTETAVAIANATATRQAEQTGTTVALINATATQQALQIATGGSGRIAFTSNHEGRDAIYTVNADGSAPTRLTNNASNDYRPAWSPDGQKLAFISDRGGQSELYVMGADGSGLIRLTDSPVSVYRPAWSPDGRQIAFSMVKGEDEDIYVLNADGSGLTRLTLTGDNYHPDWSSDGKRIVFTSNRTGNSDIYVMNANGARQTRLTNLGLNNDADWSPEGQRIVFMSNRDGNLEIYVMNADGAGQTRLTNHPAWDGSPVWSPNGQWIAFMSDRDGNTEIYVMQAGGSGQTRLTYNAVDDYGPVWEP